MIIFGLMGSGKILPEKTDQTIELSPSTALSAAFPISVLHYTSCSGIPMMLPEGIPYQ